MTQVKTTGELRPPQLTQKKGGTTRMNLIRKLYSKADGFAHGQTMAEYALILAAVAVIVYAGYQTMGTTLTTMIATVDPLF